jgi:lipoyl(octanoyl) transferase
VSASAASSCLQIRDLGSVPYERAYVLQKQLQREVIEAREKNSADEGGRPASGRGGSSSGHVLLLEHDPPVITISRRPGARRHLIATEHQLRAAGIQIAETDRGGDITYHGPGQLVVYPILDLDRLGLRIHSYMRMLEGIVIDLLARFGIAAVRDEQATGVWVPRADGNGEAPTKICAMGVRVSKWTSLHGLALNVTTNLAHFNHIIPCGLAGRTVTSMHEQLGAACPNMDDVKRAMAELFTAAVEKRVAANAV